MELGPQEADKLRYTGAVKANFSKAVLKAMEKVAEQKKGIRLAFKMF